MARWLGRWKMAGPIGTLIGAIPRPGASLRAIRRAENRAADNAAASDQHRERTGRQHPAPSRRCGAKLDALLADCRAVKPWIDELVSPLEGEGVSVPARRRKTASASH